MKLLIVSDSHGRAQPILRAVQEQRPDGVIHLGDGWRDAAVLNDEFPLLPLEQVPGNCDLGRPEPCERLAFFAGHAVFFCHGHTLGVKQSLLRAALAAKERGAEVLLFGHTHRPMVDFHDGLWMLNPGSIGSFRPTYGVLELTAGGISPALFELN